MKKFLSVMVFLAIAFGPSLTPSESAQAITCAQRDTLLAQALSSGDIAAAATYQRMSCTSGSSSGGATLTCAQRQLNIAGALSRGDTSSAAYWQAATCTGSSGGSSSGGSSSGGSSSGGSSGASSTPAAPVAPSCGGAPDAPELKVTQLVTGVRFDVTPANSGHSLSDMQYNYSLYDSSANTWSPWTSWSSMGTSAFSKTITQTSPETERVAFGVYSRNTCGTSNIVREGSDNRGLLLINPALNKIFLDPSITKGIELAQGSLELGDSVSAALGGPVELSSQTPTICTLSGTRMAVLKAGSCRLQAASEGSETALGQKATFTITVRPSKSTITCVSKTKKSIKKKITAVNPKCPSGFVKSK